MRSKDTKQKIFYAAAELFAEQCYADVSMRDIAVKVGIQAASIYNHYSSKAQILDALIEHYLKRMENFYKHLEGIVYEDAKDRNLQELLERLILVYDPKEVHLMFWITRIVYNEQFRSPEAAQALVGDGYRRYMGAFERFFDHLADLGLLHGKERNHFYAELIARITMTFAIQFLHPEIEPTIPDQKDLFGFVIPLIIQYEENVKRGDALAMPSFPPNPYSIMHS